MLKIEEINTFEQAQGLKESWDRLVEEAGLNVSLSFDFVISLWEAHLYKKDIIILMVKEENTLLGIFPLFISQKRILKIFSIDEINLLTNIFSFHNDFICKEKISEAFDATLDYVNTKYKNWHIFYIGNVSPGSKTFQYLNSNAKFKSIMHQLENAPFVALDGNWETYLHSKSQNFRKNLKRKVRTLEENGKLQFKEFEKQEDVDFILEKIYEIEKESWKEKAKISIAQNKKQKRFYEIYLKKAAVNNNLSASFLFIENEYINFILNIIDKKVTFSLKSAYKEKYAEYSPGFLIHTYTLERTFKLGFREFDLLIGSPLWKLEWATGTRKTYNIYIYNNKRLYPQFIYFLKKLVNKIKK